MVLPSVESQRKGRTARFVGAGEGKLCFQPLGGFRHDREAKAGRAALSPAPERLGQLRQFGRIEAGTVVGDGQARRILRHHQPNGCAGR